MPQNWRPPPLQLHHGQIEVEDQASQSQNVIQSQLARLKTEPQSQSAMAEPLSSPNIGPFSTPAADLNYQQNSLNSPQSLQGLYQPQGLRQDQLPKHGDGI